MQNEESYIVKMIDQKYREHNSQKSMESYTKYVRLSADNQTFYISEELPLYRSNQSESST